MTEIELLNRVVEGLRRIPVMGEENCGIMHDCIHALLELAKAREELGRQMGKTEEPETEVCPE